MGLIALCALLTPFLLDICQGLFPFLRPSPSAIAYASICFGLFLLIVTVSAMVCIRLVPSLNAANALLFTFVAMVSMRINHLMEDQAHYIEIGEAIGLILACLLVFGFHLLRRGRTRGDQSSS